MDDGKRGRCFRDLALGVALWCAPSGIALAAPVPPETAPKPLEPAPVVPVDTTARLTVDPFAIRLDGVLVADTRRLSADYSTQRIEPLIQALQTRARASRPSTVQLDADGSTQYRVVRKLLFSIAQAPYATIRIGRSAVSVDLQAERRNDGFHALAVLVTSEGYLVGTKKKVTRIAKSGSDYDRNVLRTTLIELTRREPGQRRVFMGAEDEVTFAQVVAVMELVRAAGLPDIALGAGNPVTVMPAASRQGTLSREHIREQIGTRLPDVRSCYESYLARVGSEAQAGRVRVVVKFVVAPSGSVQVAAIQDSTADDAPFNTCMLDVVRTIKFSQLAGGGVVVIDYPFVFTEPQ